MVDGVCRLDSAVERLKSSSRRVVDLRGEARELGREGFAAGRRGTAGATSSARPARLVVHASLKEEERTTLDGKLRGLREEKSGAQTRLPTRGSGAPTATVAGMAGELHRVEHRRSTVSSFE
jgi:hypothetical protein